MSKILRVVQRMRLLQIPTKEDSRILKTAQCFFLELYRCTVSLWCWEKICDFSKAILMAQSNFAIHLALWKHQIYWIKWLKTRSIEWWKTKTLHFFVEGKNVPITSAPCNLYSTCCHYSINFCTYPQYQPFSLMNILGKLHSEGCCYYHKPIGGNDSCICEKA